MEKDRASADVCGSVGSLSDGNLRREILQRGMPTAWEAEPRLGSVYGEEEVEAAVRAIRESMDPNVGFGMSDGEVDGFEQAFAQYVGTKHCVTCNGAGTGIDMALMALGIGPGDEVITQAVNFRAVPMAIAGRGGKPVYAEVDETLQLDLDDVDRKITANTRAIFPTHMNGMSAPMDELLEIADRHPHPKYGPPKVIGDGARAVGASRNGAKVGQVGWMNVFSFHTMKNMSTLGEGGAITTDDSSVVSQLHGLRQFGGEGWGSNYKMTKCQAAVGLVQLRKLDGMIGARRRLALARNAMLEGCPHLQLPVEPDGHHHSYYLYSILVSPEWAGEKRDALMEMLRRRWGVDTVVANPPVIDSFPYLKRLAAGQDVPVSRQIGKRLLCAPMHPTLADEDNEYIAAAIWEAVTEIANQA